MTIERAVVSEARAACEQANEVGDDVMIAIAVTPWLAKATGVALAATNLDIGGWLLGSEFLSVLAAAISSLLISLFSVFFFPTAAAT